MRNARPKGQLKFTWGKQTGQIKEVEITLLPILKEDIPKAIECTPLETNW